jgi:hypothetical protein
MAPIKDVFLDEQLRFVPANEATWEDLQAVLGDRDYAAYCQCQRLKITGWMWGKTTLGQRADMLRSQTACGDPEATDTSGVVAYADGEPVGWAAVEPRVAYPKLRAMRVPWSGRHEEKDDR